MMPFDSLVGHRSSGSLGQWTESTGPFKARKGAVLVDLDGYVIEVTLTVDRKHLIDVATSTTSLTM